MNGQRPKLTPRQQQILSLAAQGHGSRAIAARLSIGLRKVKRHKHDIKEQLGLPPTTTTDAMVARARAMGLIN